MDQLTLHLRGVGGQALPLVVDMLARHAQRAGWNVRTRQSFGLAQRHGVVGARVSLFRNAQPSTESTRSADAILLAFDRLEGLRGFNLLQSGARAYVSRCGTVPPGTHRSGPPYPSVEDVQWAAEHYGVQLTLVDAEPTTPWRVVQAALNDGVISVLRSASP